ncbi:hypothetical protein BUE80_DR002630 [Diplocarpon rosae]|nr:hypothetical protein BUE80_DR002630 [Diplocarpon rosae]
MWLTGNLASSRPTNTSRHEKVKMVVDRLYNLLAAEAQTSAQSLSSSTRSQQGDHTQPESPPSNNTWADIATQLDYRAEICPRNHRPELGQQPKKIDLATLLMTGKAAARVPDQDDRVNTTILQPASELRSIEVSSKLEASANEQHSQSSLSHSSNKSCDEIIVVATGNIIHSKEKGDAVTANRETSQEIVKTRIDRHENSTSAMDKEPITPNHSAEPTLLDHFQYINPFKRMKRVPRRYVRIHKDQNLLLEHKDCWYEQHGRQIRRAAIPAGVLDDLTKFMKPNSNVSQLQGQEPESSSGESEEDTETDNTADKNSGRDMADTNMGPISDDTRELNERKVIAQVSQVESRHFSSNSLVVKDVAVDVDEKTNDDDCTSWKTTPEIKKTSNEPVNSQTSHGDNLCGQQQDFFLESQQSLRPRSKPFARIPVTIPSSSPTSEEDLEIAIPHAIGDVIEVDDSVLQNRSRISQELPSGASQNSCLIQVEQTPFPKSRCRNHPSVDRSVTAKYYTPGDISSDPVIPATFNDTSILDGQISSSTDRNLSTSRAYISPTQHQRDDNQEGDATSPPQTQSHFLKGEVNRTLASPQEIESPEDPTSLLVSSSSVPASLAGFKPPSSEISPPFSQRVPASPPFATVATPTEELAKSSTATRITTNFTKPDRRRLTAPAISMSRRDRTLFQKFTDLDKNPASGRKKKDEIMMDALDKIRIARLQMKKDLAEEGLTAAIERLCPPRNEQIARQVTSTIAVDTLELSNSRCSKSTSPNPHVNLTQGLRLDDNSRRDRHTSSRTSDSLLLRDDCDDETITRKVDTERELSIISQTSLQPEDISDLEVTQSDDATFSIYDKFLALYPAYTGDEKCFIRALVCMEWMNDMGNGLHPFLYDDFVRVFPEYESITRKLPPLHRVTGRRYYDKNIKRPLFQHGLITPKNLTADLSTLNPSYVQLVRNKYYTPEPRQAESKRAIVSPIAVQAEQTKGDGFVTASRSQSKVLQAEASPELGSGDRFARKPFFETASQLHNVTDEPGVSAVSSRLDTGRSDRNSKTAKRTLPWASRSHVQSLSLQRENCSQRPAPPAQTERGFGFAGSKKRHLSTDQTRRATVPPGLRSSFSRSSPHSGRVETHARPESRDSEVFEAPASQTSTRAHNATILSPELHRYTEKWVTEQPVHEVLRTTELEKQPRKKKVDKAIAARRQSDGGLSKAVTPKGQVESSFSEFVNRRLSSGMLSKASLTPSSTPGKKFCTKRKDTIAFMGPKTKAQQY